MRRYILPLFLLLIAGGVIGQGSGISPNNTATANFNFVCSQNQVLYAIPCEGPFEVAYVIESVSQSEAVVQGKLYGGGRRYVQGIRGRVSSAGDVHANAVAFLVGNITAEHARNVKRTVREPIASGTIHSS